MVNTNAMLYGVMAGQQVGQYHLESLLGAGGFGGVFRANEVVRDRVLRQVAVKVIPGNDEAQLEELLAAATLEHDQLIRCYAAGECSLLNIDALYLAMELGEGSLETHLQQGPLEVEKVREVLREVTQGLAYLHSQKQIHRDLKPANVLRVKGRWKLSDFGLVRRLGNESYVQTANPIGTIAYMPPEAFEGKISPAWDMWSLGIMAVQMLAGSIPYQFSEPTQLLKQVMNGAIELPTLPDEFRHIVEGCLRVERGDRWSAEQVLDALNLKLISSVMQDPPPEILSNLELITENLGGGITLELIKLPAGNFLMGSSDSDPDASSHEKPQHRVTIKSFAIGKYPVTQAQYRALMRKNPSYFRGNSKYPVENISWNDARLFCSKLREKTGKKYRLPSEAEWEYACRAGKITHYSFGNNAEELKKYAWFSGNSSNGTHPVGLKKPNPWGLYDMHGNVWEWCEDSWHNDYEGAPVNGSAWNGHYARGVIAKLLLNQLKDQNPDFLKILDNPEHETNRCVLRGGSWATNPSNCRSASRYNNLSSRWRDRGFRLVLE
jgi:formylglycine-generating enzyme required for sulfatase activity